MQNELKFTDNGREALSVQERSNVSVAIESMYQHALVIEEDAQYKLTPCWLVDASKKTAAWFVALERDGALYGNIPEGFRLEKRRTDGKCKYMRSDHASFAANVECQMYQDRYSDYKSDRTVFWAYAPRWAYNKLMELDARKRRE